MQQRRVIVLVLNWLFLQFLNINKVPSVVPNSYKKKSRMATPEALVTTQPTIVVVETYYPL